MKVFKHRELAIPPPPHVGQRSPINSTLKPSQKGWFRCQLLPGFLGPSKEAGLLPGLTDVTGVKLGDALPKQVWQKLA